MKYKLTLKGFNASDTFEETLQREIQKLKKRFVHFTDDLPMMTIVLKKHDKHTFFSGSLTLQLPKKALIARCKGHHEEEVLRDGFEKIFSEFEKYKGKHFSGNSMYTDQSSIRSAF